MRLERRYWKIDDLKGNQDEVDGPGRTLIHQISDHFLRQIIRLRNIIFHKKIQLEIIISLRFFLSSHNVR